MGRVVLELDNLDVEQQYELLARKMFEEAKEDIIRKLKESLKESGGRGDRVRASWSRS